MRQTLSRDILGNHYLYFLEKTGICLYHVFTYGTTIDLII